LWILVATKEEAMRKEFIVSLTDEQREIVSQVVKGLKGSPQKVRRAQILFKADVHGPSWTDSRIAEAFSCSTQTVENVRKRFVETGFEVTLNGKKRETPPYRPRLDGEKEAQVIALRLGAPPKGYSNWTLTLLQERVVALSIVESVSRETLRKTLKKMG
jgi:transposase